MPRRGGAAHWAICAVMMWAAGSAIWVPLIFWSGILQPMIDLLNDVEASIGMQTLGAISLMHLELSIAFGGVKGLAILAAILAALVVKASAMPGWAIMLTAVLIGTITAAFVTPPDIVVQLAFIGCALVGTALGLVWGRSGSQQEVS